jgi:iron(III) transport system ATP-binding protein
MLPLTLQQLSHAYDNKPVFSNINLHIQPGEFVAILGPSGCGKSTLLRCIAGLNTPQKGSVCIAGKSVVCNGRERIPVEKRHVGMVFQDYALFPQKTVRSNIAFGLETQGLNATAIKNRVDELLQLIDMMAFADHKPHQLSGGQQQRVALARALAPKPQLLLLDEPFANVDTTLKQTLSEALQVLTAQEEVSVLLVTHDWSEAFTLADRIAILAPPPMIPVSPMAEGSSILQCDTPQHIYQRPKNSYIATLFGSTTLIPGNASGKQADTVFGTLPLATVAAGSGYAVLRSEMAAFVEDPHGSATVLARQFQGRSYRLLCDTVIGKLFAETPADSPPPAVGARGNIQIHKPCWWVS